MRKGSKMNIKEILEKIMSEYREATRSSFGGHELGETFRLAEEAFRNDLNLPDNYKVLASRGKGNWATFPWIALLNTDITTSAMRGYYIVFLFDYQMDNVYLTLNQGFDWFDENFKAKKNRNIVIMANYLRKQLNVKKNAFNLLKGADSSIRPSKNSGYELGSITSTKFEKANLDQDKIVKETRKMISLLDKISALMPGGNWEPYNRNFLSYIPSLIEYININYDSKIIEAGTSPADARANFLRDFPLSSLKDMSLEDYSKNGNKLSFTNYIERKTGALCSGSLTANRNKLFFEENGSFTNIDNFNQREGYASLETVDEKFTKYKTDLYNFINDFDEANHKSTDFVYGANVIKFKTLRLYRPELKLYGFPGNNRMKNLLTHLNIDFDIHEDSVSSVIRLSNYLKGEDYKIIEKDTDYINLLIWDFYALYVAGQDGVSVTDEEEEEENEDMENEKTTDNPIIRKIENELKNNGVKQLVLTGAPGTGKTFSAIEFVELSLKDEKDRKDLSRFVQFHPSYDYTDFVEGIRPKEENGEMKFVKKDGIFKSFCRHAVENPAKTHYFIIDEINRADLSKVFGELMFSLEEHHRVSEYKIPTQYQNIPTDGLDGEDVFKDGFYISENLIIIGTMNDIDRSVESFDFALRRRFRWINIKVDDELLQSALNSMWEGNVLPGLIGRIKSLNSVITGETGRKLGLDENYQIGPAYFKQEKVITLNDYLNKIWDTRIKSLLHEYVRGRKTDLIEKFIDECKEAF